MSRYMRALGLPPTRRLNRRAGTHMTQMPDAALCITQKSVPQQPPWTEVDVRRQLFPPRGMQHVLLPPTSQVS